MFWYIRSLDGVISVAHVTRACAIQVLLQFLHFLW